MADLNRVLDEMPKAERVAMIDHIEARKDAGDDHAAIARGVSVEWSAFGVTAEMVLTIVEDPT